jgi:hypothetical protein
VKQFQVTVTWDISGPESVTEFFILPSNVADFVREACSWQGMTSVTVSKVQSGNL